MDTDTVDDLPKHEKAFQVWCSDGEQSDQKTASILGIPRRTIAFYRSRDDWRDRWNRTVAPEALAAARSGQAIARMSTPLVMKRLVNMIGGQRPDYAPDGTIRTDHEGNPLMVWSSSDRDASTAAKLLLLYSLGPGTDGQTESVDPTYTATFLPSVNATDDEPSLAQLRESANAMLEATIQSVNTRVDTGRRKGRV